MIFHKKPLKDTVAKMPLIKSTLLGPEGFCKIINGKRYNTATSEKIHTYEYLYSGDHSHCLEELHRTFTGKFFIYGKGGPASKWSRTEGNSSTGSCGIEPLEKKEALAWCETHDVPVSVMEINFRDLIRDA